MTMVPERTGVRTTDPDLLARVRDWRDGQAWALFVGRYEPRLRAVCRAYGLVGAAADDCCQQVWIKLADAMRRFHYDPGRGFGRWLRMYFHCRVKDILRASRHQRGEARMTHDVAFDRVSSKPDGDDEPRDPEVLAMLRRAEEVQDAVRSRVTPENWEVFRLVGIEGRPITETAMILGREYTTVYRAYKRVSRMIADQRGRSPR